MPSTWKSAASSGTDERQGRIGEQEDRLRLDASLAEQTPAFLADARVRALVRKHASVRVRRGRDRDDHAAALARDAVRADELLHREPHRGLGVVFEDTVREPLAVEPPGLVGRLGKRDVDDVVRAARVQRRALLVVDGVVRRCDEIRQRAGRAGVADGAKRLDVGHRGERTNGFAPYSRDVTTIAELVEDRTVEGVFAVARKERRRTRAGASYLALELVDASGRVEARVWNDVDLLDQRFDEGDAVRVLGRVERFGGKLQVQVRTVEAAEDADPSSLTPTLRRDADELDGFFEFLASEISHEGLAAVVDSFVRDADIRKALRSLPAASADGHHGYAGGLLEHTVGVATLCRETAQLHPRLRHDLVLAAALLHDVGRIRELGPGPAFRPTDEGRLLGHVHLGLRMIEERGRDLDPAVLAELLHAVACHHDRPAARTAEAAVLYHANQLDAQAATRPVGDD